jgi:hypothetical protein
LYGVETWTVWKEYQKHLENVKMRCWRRLEMISWTDRVKNEEVLHGDNEERNSLKRIKRRKVKWIGHILPRNCLLRHVIERKKK